jgi:hypothetical protein
MDVVKQLNLREIYRPYELEHRGQPPYNPTMMVTLLIYAYTVGDALVTEERTGDIPLNSLPDTQETIIGIANKIRQHFHSKRCRKRLQSRSAIRRTRSTPALGVLVALY